MPFGALLKPGVWCMRSLRFAGKLCVLALIALFPVVIALWQVMAGGDPVKGLEWVAMATLLSLLLTVYFLFALHASVVPDLVQVQRVADDIVAGDLRTVLTSNSQDEFGQLTTSMSKLGRTVSGMVANVRSNAAFVAHSGQSMAAGNRELSDRTEQQAANLEETAASVEQLSSTVQHNATTASQANARAAEVRDVAESGATTMTQAIASVEAIQAGAKRMDEIVGVIDGLAFQTNILALNAAVEAARAGESGRGFAVVATEVRSLAQRSAESAKEIRQLISASSSQVATSVEKIRAAGTNMTQIVAGIRDVATNMSQISTSSAEQSAGLSEITSAVHQIDEITQQNAKMVEHAVTQAVNLEGRATTLVQSVAMFKLQQGSAEEAQALVAKAMAHRRHTSKDSFLRELTDPARGFHDRDMYVFVLDGNGAYVAFGGNPAKVGTRVQDIPGIDGQGLLDSIVEQANREPGWVEYDITNPSTGKVQTKMSYVQQVDGLYAGCGVYKNLVG
jgi:methyl-accepting chemotaxis protein